MPVGSCGSLLTLSAQSTAKQRTIPLIENRTQLVRALDMYDRRETSSIQAVFLRHCNLFELALDRAYQRELATYVNIDHIDGVHADSAGLRYLAEHMHVTGVISSHPRILSLAKSFELETIQRVFAVDSTGIEAALESVETETIDLLDISPALVVPHIVSQLQRIPRPFVASGLVQTSQQLHAVLGAGAIGVVVARDELWLS